MLGFAPGIAHAQEAVNYGYDARGRLVAVSYSSGPANGIQTTYQYDAAGNRTNVAATSSASSVIVVPLSGLKVMVIR